MNTDNGNGRETRDYIAVVTALEGMPLRGSDIAGRIGDFDDVAALEEGGATDAELVAAILNTKNDMHNNYQDAQAFLDAGGKIGIQHDPLLAGAYSINQAVFRIKTYPMLVVEQGEVAVIKAYVGREGSDTSGEEFKFGSLVRPGHKGVWTEVLRTGKYAINPSCYAAVIVPTSILTLNWANSNSAAHKLDSRLQAIVAKSKEGFEIKIDLQVQIHIPDTKAAKVISAVGTVENLVDEVLQAAVGNHFRDKLQSMSAVKFIEERQEIQKNAFDYIKEALAAYDVETVGVYIQDVIYPKELITVLTDREIAKQKVETYKEEENAQKQRINMEKQKGIADKQAELAAAETEVSIKTSKADARKKEADGEAYYIKETVEAKQLAEAAGYLAKVEAIGPEATALTNMVELLANSQEGIKILPEFVVLGSEGSGVLDALLATLTKKNTLDIKEKTKKEEQEQIVEVDIEENKAEEENVKDEEGEETEEAEEVEGEIQENESLKQFLSGIFNEASDILHAESIDTSLLEEYLSNVMHKSESDIVFEDFSDLFSLIDRLGLTASRRNELLSLKKKIKDRLEA